MSLQRLKYKQLKENIYKRKQACGQCPKRILAASLFFINSKITNMNISNNIITKNACEKH